MCAFLCSVLCFAELLVGSWNLRWFPSGRAEHRAPVPVEERAMDDAAAAIREGIARRRPGDHMVLFLQELRSEEVCSNLVARIGATSGLKVASVSAFRMWDRRLGWQQNGIATDLPVLDANFSYWRRSKKILPPRGYAYALLDAGEEGLVACYCVHLKSNYGARTPEEKRENEEKRELAASQLVDITKKIRAPDGRRVTRIIIAGDFNTSPFDGAFPNEKTVPMLVDAGYVNCFAGVPPSERGTCPGHGRFPDSTFDYIFHRGFESQLERWLSPPSKPSDHRAVWLRVK